jgi:hypothetical protein
VERHLSLLGVLASVWGALAAVVGVSMLILCVGACAEWLDPAGTAVEFAALLAAIVFGGLGLSALVWGGAHLWAAALLRQHRPAGRILMLCLAVANLVVLPFGTAFGTYACWVLLTHDTAALFGPHAPNPHQPVQAG